MRTLRKLAITLKFTLRLDETQASPLKTHLVFTMTPCIRGKRNSVFSENSAVFRWNISGYAENTSAFAKNANAHADVISKFA